MGAEPKSSASSQSVASASRLEPHSVDTHCLDTLRSAGVDQPKRGSSQGAPSQEAEGAADGARPGPAHRCFSTADLIDFREGTLATAEREERAAHLDECLRCQEEMMLFAHSSPGVGASGSCDGEPGGRGAFRAFRPGEVIGGRYRVEAFVGRGGMGEVYRAYDKLMDKPVALKTILCTDTDKPRAVRKLKDEVNHAQLVCHSNVCRINELQQHVARDRGSVIPFFTMEFVEGERLGERLRSGPLPVEETRELCFGLLEGLAAAHRRGVLHLDFKSDNVLLRCGSGEPVIMDFGLSRALGSEPSVLSTDRATVAGTLPYMSMEQLKSGRDVGPPADVYAFGVVMYEMLTGQRPFRGTSVGALVEEQLEHRPLPPSGRGASLHPAVDAFVMRCLERRAEQRFANADEALSALRGVPGWRPLPGARGILAGRMTLGAASSCVLVGAALWWGAGGSPVWPSVVAASPSQVRANASLVQQGPAQGAAPGGALRSREGLSPGELAALQDAASAQAEPPASSEDAARMQRELAAMSKPAEPAHRVPRVAAEHAAVPRTGEKDSTSRKAGRAKRTAATAKQAPQTAQPGPTVQRSSTSRRSVHTDAQRAPDTAPPRLPGLPPSLAVPSLPAVGSAQNTAR